MLIFIGKKFGTPNILVYESQPFNFGFGSSTSTFVGVFWASMDWCGDGIRLPRSCFGNANIANDVTTISADIINRPKLPGENN